MALRIFEKFDLCSKIQPSGIRDLLKEFKAMSYLSDPYLTDAFLSPFAFPQLKAKLKTNYYYFAKYFLIF